MIICITEVPKGLNGDQGPIILGGTYRFSKKQSGPQRQRKGNGSLFHR